MEISGKTSFSERRFTNIHLSTGQRKRLALVVSYLEDKPVMFSMKWRPTKTRIFAVISMKRFCRNSKAPAKQ